jgi:hypothetical protein
VTEAVDMIDSLELIIRRAVARAMNNVAYNLRHYLEGEILQIVGGKNIAKTTQKLAKNKTNIELGLSSVIEKLIEREIKALIKPT